MKSGLEDRNNVGDKHYLKGMAMVSMKSGLEDRNNYRAICRSPAVVDGLNEVRPGRPEQ